MPTLQYVITARHIPLDVAAVDVFSSSGIAYGETTDTHGVV